MNSVRNYVKNIADAVVTTAVGMRITWRYLLQKPITVQYPDEILPIPNRFRGVHYLEQEKCINCLACARACPVDCIEMDAVRHGKELEWVKFTIDYQKCMFCELCVYPCPKDCIHMGTEYAMVSDDRSEFLYDLLSYRGMARDAKVRMKDAEEKKKAKAAAKKAKLEAEKKKKAAEAAKAAAEGGDGAEAETPAKAEKPATKEKPAKPEKATPEEPEPDEGGEA